MQSPPDWQEILLNFRGSELQNYFTRVLEDNIKVCDYVCFPHVRHVYAGARTRSKGIISCVCVLKCVIRCVLSAVWRAYHNVQDAYAYIHHYILVDAIHVLLYTKCSSTCLMQPIPINTWWQAYNLQHCTLHTSLDRAYILDMHIVCSGGNQAPVCGPYPQGRTWQRAGCAHHQGPARDQGYLAQGP